MFNSFKIIKKISAFYHLKLFSNIHQHDVFLFNYLKSVVNDSLLNQKQELLKLIIVDDEKV